MGSRALARVVTPNSIALNAYIYGYAGHSLVTPHAPLQQIWWTQERIDAKVTPDFVASRLRKEERDLLHQKVGFGDGLTDDTYLEWILERAKRLYLILAEIGVPDQIFGVIDDSWDDEDLPIPLDAVERLALSYTNDDHLNRNFYHTQFTFLLRELHRGHHIAYGENEVIPLEYVYKLPAAVSLQNWSRVHFPKRPDNVFVRRRMSLSAADVQDDPLETEFRRDVKTAQAVEHDHIAPVWASYTAKGSAFTVTPFVGQHTLKTFIEHRSAPQYMRIPKHDRQELLLRWLHCLSDAVAKLHRNGLCHGEIRPSNILVDANNEIAFSDIGTLKSFQRDKKTVPDEIYTYAPPEAHAPTLAYLLDTSNGNEKTRDRASRPPSVQSKTSSQRSFSPSSTKPKKKGRRSLPTSPITSFDFGFGGKPPKDTSTTLFVSSPQADIFSLGCIFLDILTFLMSKKTATFTKHRSSKHKTSEEGRGTRLDSSFHANLEKLDSWMAILDSEAFDKDDRAFRAVPALLDLVKAMLSPIPGIRPDADDVTNQVRTILAVDAQMLHLHCAVHDYPPRMQNSSATRSSISPSTAPVAIPIRTPKSPSITAFSPTRSLASRYTPSVVSSVVSSVPELDEDSSTVADTATLRYSVADSVGESVTAMGSPGALSWRRKSAASGSMGKSPREVTGAGTWGRKYMDVG
ncbi:kinase-like protein [Saccharata proteae CBS 121410]|uniref:Kinase-like protein n=1 Tax=Saccharata proteae CBS 121410 TaxID=1314787 RepID=A0A6A5YBL1_9PEZI|nr:kinase-like protein [Saccharata proteae CBS 121410]